MGSKAMVPVSDRRRVRRSEAQWCALVGAFAKSGTSRRAFCVQHGVALSTFDWWRKRLGAQPPAGGLGRNTEALFVELTAPGELATASKRVAPVWDVEWDLGAGVVLRLRRSAPAC